MKSGKGWIVVQRNPFGMDKARWQRGVRTISPAQVEPFRDRQHRQAQWIDLAMRCFCHQVLEGFGLRRQLRRIAMFSREAEFIESAQEVGVFIAGNHRGKACQPYA